MQDIHKDLMILSHSKQSSDTAVRARDDKAKTQILIVVVSLYFIKENKLTYPYYSKPYTVTKIRGSMVRAFRREHSIVRNSQFFQKGGFTATAHPNES